MEKKYFMLYIIEKWTENCRVWFQFNFSDLVVLHVSDQRRRQKTVKSFLRLIFLVVELPHFFDELFGKHLKHWFLDTPLPSSCQLFNYFIVCRCQDDTLPAPGWRRARSWRRSRRWAWWCWWRKGSPSRCSSPPPPRPVRLGPRS